MQTDDQNPIALTIAGFDCSSGAGIQADLKVFSSFGVHCLTATTCIVSESPNEVRAAHIIPANVLEDQLGILFDSYPIKHIKIGVICSEEQIRVICKYLDGFAGEVVIDPVGTATTGFSFRTEKATNEFLETLLPLGTVITPNIPEASEILNRPILSLTDLISSSEAFAKKFDVGCYLKGGHLEIGGKHFDHLSTPSGSQEFTSPSVKLPQTHGTGCTLSSALTACLCLNHDLFQAAKKAHSFTAEALRKSLTWTSPRTNKSIHHLKQFFDLY